MWNLPGPGVEPVSPVLVGGFLSTVLPGKPHKSLFTHKRISISVLLEIAKHNWEQLKCILTGAWTNHGIFVE